MVFCRPGVLIALLNYVLNYCASGNNGACRILEFGIDSNRGFIHSRRKNSKLSPME